MERLGERKEKEKSRKQRGNKMDGKRRLDESKKESAK